MALDPMVASSEISRSYLARVSLDGNGYPTEVGPIGDYPELFAAGYKEYAEMGIVLGAENEESDESIIRNALGKSTNVTELATAFATYWSTVAVLPGAPAHGGMFVISVTNDAMARIPQFEAAIRASMTDLESKPYFYTFVNNIESIAVSTIIWTVTEMMAGSPPSPSSFPEPII